MPSSVSTRPWRHLLFAAMFILFYAQWGGQVGAMPEQCSDICDSGSPCDEPCGIGWTMYTCNDYGYCSSPGYCGDGYCAPVMGEDFSNCPGDCDLGPPGGSPVCGDANCERPAENSDNCPGECANLGDCGDGVCDLGESPGNCSADCVYAGYCGYEGFNCDWGYACVGNRCVWNGQGNGFECDWWGDCWGAQKCVTGWCVPAY
jgi:hypothetical protein